MSGYKAGMDQEFSGQELERAKASGVWHSKSEYDALWEAHQKAKGKPETALEQPQTPEPIEPTEPTEATKKNKEKR